MMGDSRSALCRETFACLRSMPATAQSSMNSLFPLMRENCFEEIHYEYTTIILALVVLILALRMSVLHLGLS